MHATARVSRDPKAGDSHLAPCHDTLIPTTTWPDSPSMDPADARPALTVEDMQTYRRHVEEAASFLDTELLGSPTIGLVVPGQSSRLVADASTGTVLTFDEIPHFPKADGRSEPGRLIEGTRGESSFICVDGALALYEGFTPQEVVFPIRMLAEVGIHSLLLVTPAIAVNSEFEPSDLVVVTDHINFQGVNPLVGPNVDAWGPRFPDMSEPYDPVLRQEAVQIALDEGVRLEQGVLFALLGPNGGTRAEYKMVEMLGADVASMRTVPEVIAAQHMGVSVLSIAVVIDRGSPDALEPVSMDEVAHAIDSARPHLRSVITGLVDRVLDGEGAPGTSR